MIVTLMKSKIHRATVTGADLDYEGSLSVDKILLEKALMYPHEKVQVVNLNNGNRFETYVIEAKAGSGDIRLNGPAARLGLPGDKIIIITYCGLTPEEAAAHKPVVVKVDSHNQVV